MPPLLVKLYVWQICRAIAYTHALGVCHRDIKPQNLLVDGATHVLKLCDFGSAKVRGGGTWAGVWGEALGCCRVAAGGAALLPRRDDRVR